MSPASQGPATLHNVAPDPEPGVSLLQVEGALSSDDSTRWRQALATAIEGDGVPTRAVILDLRGCSLLAPTCMRVMLDASDELAGLAKTPFRVVMDIGDPVAQGIWRQGQNRLFFHPSMARALEDLRG